MVYTDALDSEVDAETLPEDDPAQPEFVHKIEKELCMDCKDQIWTVYEVRRAIYTVYLKAHQSNMTLGLL